MMSMLNQAAVEALCSATYLENYLDCMDNLPDDLQRVVSQLRELDSQTNEILRDITHHQELYLKQDDGSLKKRALIQIQRGLVKSQQIGDEKLQLVSHIVEHIETRTRQLEQDLENLDPGATQQQKEEVEMKPATKPPAKPPPGNVSKATKTEEKQEIVSKVKRQRRPRQLPDKEEEKKEEEEKPKKKKKKKGGTNSKKDSKLEFDTPIDPDEPTYCLCEQVSYGEMIGCDNDSCPIEWFHFNCVQLTHKPKGKWYCPKCRGDRPNIKRPDLK